MFVVVNVFDAVRFPTTTIDDPVMKLLTRTTFENMFVVVSAFDTYAFPVIDIWNESTWTPASVMCPDPNRFPVEIAFDA